MVLLVSLRNRTAGRRGQQNVSAWQTWQGYNVHVMSWSSLRINVLWFLQKDLFKGKWCLAKSYFNQNYCHACHTRFAVFFPLPSCCVSSLIRSLRDDDGDGNENSKKAIGLRWCYTRRFATTIFSATQRCNIVVILFWTVTTLFQHSKAVLS